MRLDRALTTLIVLAICVAIPTSALLACMADVNAGATAQMACCKGAKPDCPQPSKTLQCCKSADHPQQQNVVNARPVIGSVVMQSVTMPFAAVAQVLPAMSFSARQAVALFAGTTSPPHLLSSALLI
jgi:hypothetical protein